MRSPRNDSGYREGKERKGKLWRLSPGAHYYLEVREIKKKLAIETKKEQSMRREKNQECVESQKLREQSVLRRKDWFCQMLRDKKNATPAPMFCSWGLNPGPIYHWAASQGFFILFLFWERVLLNTETESVKHTFIKEKPRSWWSHCWVLPNISRTNTNLS